MPLTLSFDNSAVCDLALAIAKLSPLEAAATLRELKARPSFRGINWDVVMAGAISAAQEAPADATGTFLSVPRGGSLLIGKLGTGVVAPTAEVIGTQTGLDVSDLGAVSNPAIFDQTSGVNAALDTGNLDVTAWRSVLLAMKCSAGTSALIASWPDDTGAFFFNLLTPAAAISGIGAIGPGVGAGGTSAGFVFNGPLPRQIRITCGAAGVGNTVRLRIEGRR